MANTQKLEDILKEIEQLNSGLYSRVITQPKITHTVERCSQYQACEYTPIESYFEEFVVQEEKTEPDLNKIEESAARLIQIYNNPPILIAKHLAGRYLSMKGYKNYQYSKTRTFLHDLYESPTLGEVTGPIIIGSIIFGGLAYFLYTYSSSIQNFCTDIYLQFKTLFKD